MELGQGLRRRLRPTSEAVTLRMVTSILSTWSLAKMSTRKTKDGDKLNTFYIA